jgi:hypothetical protein
MNEQEALINNLEKKGIITKAELLEEIKELMKGTPQSINRGPHPTCKSAQRIKPANLVRFKSQEEACKAGYIPVK